MESAGPEHPKARPIDRTSLSDAQKKSFQETVDQAREEETARRQSMPTKLFGWMLIATLGFDIAAGLSGTDVNLGGVIMFFAGVAVLRGSQAALRFSTFLLIILAVFGWIQSTLTLLSVRPLEIGRNWVDFRQVEFWSLGICPNVYFTTAVILAFGAFRKRGVLYWSPLVKKLSIGVAVLFLVDGSGKMFDFVRNNRLASSFPEEIAFAREVMTSSVLGSPKFSTRDRERTFESMTSVSRIGWSTSPNSSYMDYSSASFLGNPSATRRIRSYTEWQRLPSGKWAKLELEFILPESP